MAKTVTDATADLTTAVSAIATDVANALSLIADSVSQHVANGTASDAIEAQAQRLRDLDAQLVAGETPAPPPVVDPGPDTNPGPVPPDVTLAGGNGDDSVSA